MSIFSVFSLFGGLAFFLYGMNVMSGGLEKMAGGRLQRALKQVTDNKFKSLLFGAGVTIAIQSSSAMTVMLVGFVNSGIMELGQTIGIIMGSNIGTTLTAWILSLAGVESDNLFIQMLNPEHFSPVIALIGIILMMAAKSPRKKDIGNVLLGFSILMFGMSLMSAALSPLAQMPQFSQILVAFQNPILGVLAGAIFTGIIQSSAASVGILQALSLTGGITYGMAMPIIMGQNIGTCVTALLSSIGVNRNAKRVAMVHIYFNMIGTVVCLGAFYLVHGIVNFAFVGQPISPIGIAGVHSIFNLVTTAVLLPFTGRLERLAKWTIKEREQENVTFLDERLLATPSVAISECREQTIAMARLVQDTIFTAIQQLKEYSVKKIKEIEENEIQIDRYEDKLGSYLMKVCTKELSQPDGKEVAKILHVIGDFERIGDHALNLAQTASEMQVKKQHFSKKAARELETLAGAVEEIISMSMTAYLTDDIQLAKEVEPLEQVVDRLCDELKNRHIKRLRQGDCTLELSFAFGDLLNNFERISDHCSNIAISLIQVQESDHDAHGYLLELKESNSEAFHSSYKSYKKKYKI